MTGFSLKPFYSGLEYFSRYFLDKNPTYNKIELIKFSYFSIRNLRQSSRRGLP